jgi:threonine/homoserine/homoserine lactone efflux protein
MNPVHWLDPFLSGITFGLLLAVMLGPVFFTLLQTSLHEGFRAGVFLAIGVFISDLAVIIICYSFASLLKVVDTHHRAMSWIGGLLLVGFGIFNFFHRVKIKEIDDEKKTVHAHFILKGFLLNMVNPAVFLFWLGVVGLISVREGYTRVDEGIFFCSVLLTVFSTDLLKSFVANRIKNILKPNIMLWINRVIGIVLVGFGIHMILS